MLFQNICVSAALAVFLPPALANPIEQDIRDVGLAVEITPDSVILTDDPELFDIEKRFAEAEPQVNEDVSNFESRAALSSDQSKALSLHNAARAKKYIGKLVWDSTLASAALAYAKQMAKSGKFQHSAANTRSGQGENLAYQWSTGTVSNPISQGVQRWLDEAKYYHNEPIPKGEFSKYGHYTQCMWKKSTRVGIATASNGKGAWYTVARYSPAGNVGGQKPY